MTYEAEWIFFTFKSQVEAAGWQLEKTDFWPVNSANMIWKSLKMKNKDHNFVPIKE